MESQYSIMEKGHEGMNDINKDGRGGRTSYHCEQSPEFYVCGASFG